MARTNGGTRVDDVRERLRADILAGRLTPGERLKFPRLCDAYDTSVGVVREALNQLVAEGLVQTQTHQGYTVTPLSHQDLAELTTARVEIESIVLRLSILEGDMSWEANAVAAHHVLSRTPMTEPDDPDRLSDTWVEAHAQFHLTLLQACPNRRLLKSAQSLREEAELYRRWSLSLGHEPKRDVAGEHRNLLEASTARNADLAAEHLREHIAHTAQLLITCAEDEPVSDRTS